MPVTEELTRAEVESDYEWNTGQAILRRFERLDPRSIQAVLVAGHGPFTWGESAKEAAHNAVILEELARTAFYTLSINPEALTLYHAWRDKHFLRKHGAEATYGQSNAQD